jgi:hypothetical protein
MNVRLKVVMLVFVLALAPCATARVGDQEGAAPPPSAAVQVKMPAAQAPAADDLLVYLRLRSPQEVVNQLGGWAGIFKPGMNAQALSEQLKVMGLDLAELRSGGNAAWFMWMKSPSGQDQQQPVAGRPSVRWALLLPAPPDSQLAKTIAAKKPDLAEAALAGDLLVAKDQASIALAQKSGDELAKLAKAPLAEDAQVYVNVEGLMKAFGPMLHGWAAMFGAMVGQKQAPGQSADQQAQMQRLIKAELDAVLGALDQVSRVTRLDDIEANHLELSAVVQAKPGSKLAALMAGGPGAAPELSGYLARGYVIGAQLSVPNMAGLIPVYQGLITRMCPPDEPEGLQQVLKALDGWKQIKSLDYAFGMYRGEKGKMTFDGVMQTSSDEQAETLMRLMRESPKIMESGAMGAVAMGVKYHVQVHQGARRLGGHPVDRYEMSIQLPDDFPAQQRQVMEMMYGSKVTFEMVGVGRSVLVSLNEPVDALYRRFESGRPGAGLAAIKEFGPGAALYADVDVAGYVEMVGTLMSAAGKDAPQLPKIAGPPLTIAGYHQDGTGWYRLRVSRQLVASVVQELQKIKQQKEQQKAQQQNQQGEDGGEQQAKPAGAGSATTPVAR